MGVVPRKKSFPRLQTTFNGRIRRLEVNQPLVPEFPPLRPVMGTLSLLWDYTGITTPTFNFDSTVPPYSFVTPSVEASGGDALVGVDYTTTPGAVIIPALTMWWAYIVMRVGPLGGTASGGIGYPRAPDAWVFAGPNGSGTTAKYIPVDPATLPSEYLDDTAPSVDSQDIFSFGVGATGNETKIVDTTLFTARTVGMEEGTGFQFVPVHLIFNIMFQQMTDNSFSGQLNW